MNSVQAAAQRVWRTPRGIARGDHQVAYLLGDRVSTWRVAQDGREALMRPGDFVLVDARRPYHFDFPTGSSSVSLELPLDWLARWVAEPQAHTARPCRADSEGWGAALAAFARPWRPDMATAPPLPAELLTDQLGALLSLACQPRCAQAATIGLASSATQETNHDRRHLCACSRRLAHRRRA